MKRKPRLRLAPVRSDLGLASSAQRDRVPSSMEVLGQLRLYGKTGVSAAKIADTIGARTINVLVQLRLLRTGGWTFCPDDVEDASSKWFIVDRNPATVALV